MAKAQRLERMDERRIELEVEYRAALTAALRVTAAGKWGLFDHQQHAPTRRMMKPIIEELAEIGDAIEDLRAKLGLPPFELQRAFLAARGRPRPDAVGEPRQAQAWLARLDADA